LVDLARFSNINLMIGGESGTGKELAAKLMHTLDARPKKGEFVIVDCTTIIPTLAGSELFGHERGAFTGAERAREGAFARANGGTLFLDEIAELALPLQAELLRVIQEGTYKPVGGNDWCKTEFRLVCATHRDLAAAVDAGTFRQDLYFRIASAEIRLPPLRERRDDIPKLAEHFLTELRPDCGGLDKHLIAFLQAREWPGNIRELRHYVQRIAARHCGTGLVTIGSLPREEIALVTPEQPPQESRDSTPQKQGADLEAAVRGMLREGIALPEIARRAGDLAVEMVLEDERGNLHRAARRLGVTDRALQQRRQRRAGTADGADDAASLPPSNAQSPAPASPAHLEPVRWKSKPSFESMKGDSSPSHKGERPRTNGEPTS
jgi:DNA-binding NtrC family response regulator